MGLTQPNGFGGQHETQFAKVNSPPSDKFHLVYLTMLLHGVGTLIPWNMFVNAKNYFESYKLGSQGALWYSANFFPFFFWSSQLPNLIFAWANIIYPRGTSLRRRIVFTLSIEVLVCSFTMALIPVDTSNTPGTFFWLTILSVALLNTAASLFQNSVYGIASVFGYAGAVVLGSNMCGLLVSLTSLVVMVTSPSSLTSALFYFGFGTLLMLLCLLAFLKLPALHFYRHYDPDDKQSKPEADLQIHKTHTSKYAEYSEAFKQCWVQCFNVFTVFLVTFAIFPGIYANVKVLEPNFPISDSKYFTEVTCFLTFNLFAFLGNILADWVQWPSDKYLCVPVLLRVLILPFFLVCNYHPVGLVRNEGTVLFGNWSYWTGGALLGLTHGHFTSLAMTYCPRSGQTPEQASKAGMLGAAFLVMGVFLGVNLSVVAPSLVSARPT